MKKYSKEFKEETLKLPDEIGVKKTANQLWLQYYTLAECRKNRKAATKLPDPATDAAQSPRTIRQAEPAHSSRFSLERRFCFTPATGGLH